MKINSPIQKTQGDRFITSQAIFWFQRTPPFKCHSNVYSSSFWIILTPAIAQAFTFLGFGGRFYPHFGWIFSHIFLTVTVKTEVVAVTGVCRLKGWGCLSTIKDWNLTRKGRDCFEVIYCILVSSVSQETQMLKMHSVLWKKYSRSVQDFKKSAAVTYWRQIFWVRACLTHMEVYWEKDRFLPEVSQFRDDMSTTTHWWLYIARTYFGPNINDTKTNPSLSSLPLFITVPLPVCFVLLSVITAAKFLTRFQLRC